MNYWSNPDIADTSVIQFLMWILIPRVLKIGGCLGALSSFSLAVKHTMKDRSCLPLCSFPVWSAQTGPHFPLNPGKFLSAEDDPYLWQNMKNVSWRRQNPVRLCTVYMQHWKENLVPLFCKITKDTEWSSISWALFLHSISSTSARIIYNVI